MLKLTKYDRNCTKDIAILLEKRRMSQKHLNNVPKLGMCVYDDDTLVAYGALRKIEGDGALLDGYITNPDFSSETRHEALDILTEGLIHMANTYNMSHVLAITTEDTIVSRALNHGLEVLADYKILVRRQQ